ncbi:MAG: hypothetical protein LC122_13470 [Chitinophagales bacterium]|nr:hypothetical protein [Chitinophagales bacterium]
MKLNLFKFADEQWKKIKKELETSDDPKKYKPLQPTDFMTINFISLLKHFGLSKNNYVGKGKFNIVFEKSGLIYKFTKNKIDIDKALMFQNLKDELPEKYKKFVMEIYEATFHEPSKFYVLICEKLYPLSVAEKQLLLKEEAVTEKDLVFSTFLTLNNYKKILEDLASNEDNEHLKSAIKSILEISSLNKKCYDFLIDLIKKVTDVKKISQAIVRGIYKFISINLMELGPKLETYNRALAIVETYLSSFRRLPKIEESDLPLESDTEYFGGDVLEFVRYLRDQKGIRWADLHTSNLMKRANGEFVLSDVGFFRVD